MPNIFGALRIADSDLIYNSTVGQRAIYDAASAYVAAQNAALSAMLSIFVEETTEDYARRYKLPGSGYLQRRGGQAQSGAVKAGAGWDIALPLEDFGAQIAGDRVTMAYMSAADLSRHIDTVTVQNINTLRLEVLKALFRNTSRTFVDEYRGSLTIQPLANGDSVVYPPVIGATDEATAAHYLASGYTSANISNTNDPVTTMARKLTKQFGMGNGAMSPIVFVNEAETAKIGALSAFVDVDDPNVRTGSATDTAINLPAVPGTVIGRVKGVAWIVQWDWIPADYMLAIHPAAPAPLLKRRDPAATGLPADLALISTDAETPFAAAHWSHRFGIGVGNRLNGVVMKLTAGSYDVPTAFQ